MFKQYHQQADLAHAPAPPPVPPRHEPLRKSASLQSSLRSQQSSVAPDHAAHNLSQDSGVLSSASPAAQVLMPGATTGVYDNYLAPAQQQQNVIEVAPTPPSSSASLAKISRVPSLERKRSQSPKWRLGNFFKRKTKEEENEEHFRHLVVRDVSGERVQPPPLPPRQQQQTGFQPTLQVKPEIFQRRSASLPGHGMMQSPTVPQLSPFSNYDNGLYFCSGGEGGEDVEAGSRRLSWKEQKEGMMQRVEAKRNSLIASSEDEEEGEDEGAESSSFFDETSSQNSSVLRHSAFGSANGGSARRRSRHGGGGRRTSRDLQQAQIDVVNRMSQIEGGAMMPQQLAILQDTPSPASYAATPPPPPPPRDPRRRLHLIHGEGGRPVSYSFERISNVVCSPAPSLPPEEPSDLGLPVVPRMQQHQVHLRPQQVYQQHPDSSLPHYATNLLSGHHLSASDQHLASPSCQIISSSVRPTFASQPYPAQVPPASQRGVFDETPRSRRPIQLNRSLPPQQQPSHHTSQPSLLPMGPPPPMVNQNPPAEYWKPPPPFSAIPLHRYDKARLAFSDDSRDCSPHPPLRKKQTSSSGRSGGHATSRDSVISPHQTTTSCSSIEKSGKSSPSSVSSKDSGCSEPNIKQSSKPLATLVEKSESTDRILELAKTPPEQKKKKKETSPVRSAAGDPGFSTKQRRHKFLDAMNELEDVIVDIQKDQDLLDRAERRDLPTAHQELIAQARERFQGGPSEETSRQDGDDSAADGGVFSDLDNFMNWNTSSSFENIDASACNNRSSRTRTPSNRRSGVYDKKTDDVVYRICRSNNRPPPETLNPIAKVDHSYLLQSPVAALNATNLNGGSTSKIDSIPNPDDEDEPDVVTDDLSFRHFRDANSNNISDPQPKFGIPKDPSGHRSDRDYLHAVPDSARYRSTFNSSRNPDLVLDDLAFRALRKDGSLVDPAGLGNRGYSGSENDEKAEFAPAALEHQKKAEEAEKKRVKEEVALEKKDPYVFYPNKHNAVMKSLSEHIAKTVRRQSVCPRGAGIGEDDGLVTFDDLRDPAVYEAVRYALNIADAEEVERRKREAEDVEWSGKNVFELLTSNISQLLEKKKRTREEEAEGAKVEEQSKQPSSSSEVVVQHCILEHDLESFNQRLRRQLRLDLNNNNEEEEGKKSTTTSLVDMVDNHRTATMDAARSDSEAREEGCKQDLKRLQEEEEKREALEKEESEKKKSTKESSSSPKKRKNKSSSKKSSSGAKKDPQSSSNNPGEMVVCTGSVCQDETLLDYLLGRPLLLVAYYALACLHQISGLDFLTAMGVVLAAVSMISIYFL